MVYESILWVVDSESWELISMHLSLLPGEAEKEGRGLERKKAGW